MKKRYIVIGVVAAVATFIAASLCAIGYILADEGFYDEDYLEYE